MNRAPLLSRSRLEALDEAPSVLVQEVEFRRLLGYPAAHEPGERVIELADMARRWYAENGHPWVYLRECDVTIEREELRLDGVEFQSKPLLELLRTANAKRAMLVAVSAGRSCEDYARQLWQESKPDEYFFIEMFGSAVVERLMATMNGRICELAEREQLVAISHYSPGYTGWDVADQTKLFPLIVQGATKRFPEPLEVLSSGMLRPKKSLLAVVGLMPRVPGAEITAPLTPCTSCSFSPCSYRRAPYRHAATANEPAGAPAVPAANAPRSAPLTLGAKYSVAPRALQKWANERVQLERRPDGTTAATFHFDGTTCSNMGQPLAFDYAVSLSARNDGYRIMQVDCRPSPGDDGHKQMCSYLTDATDLMHAIAAEKPLLGRSIDEVLSWIRPSAPSGCYCTAASRTHKWGLALEVIHFALAQSESSASAAKS